MAITTKKTSTTKGMDLYYMYRIVKDLSTPFDKMLPFQLGLIDEKGKKLKKAKTKEEKNAMDFYNRFIINIKRLFSKVGLNSKLGTFAAAMMLLKEDDLKKLKEEDMLKIIYENIDYLSKHKVYKDIIEDAPTNATGAAVAGTGDDPVHWKKMPYRVGRKGEKKRIGRYINGVEYLKKLAREKRRLDNESRKT